jgi:tetraacyldisaccharide 4'-kinase
LITLLKGVHRVSVLSRGYGRNSKGYLLLNETHTAEDAGDEPLEYLTQFDTIQVAVSEKRVVGYQKLKAEKTPTEVLLLDDAFQHRAFSAGMNILVTTYDNLYCNDYLLPAGRLRESRSGAKRAQIILISKSPAVVSSKDRAAIASKLKLSVQQHFFFTSLAYGAIYSFHTHESSYNADLKQLDVYLFTGIGNDQPIVDYLKSKVKSVWVKKFADHHPYSANDIADLYQLQNKQPSAIFITTEKDAVRLRSFHNNPYLLQLPLYILPVNVIFTTENEQQQFNDLIINYVRKNKINS